MSPEHDNNLQPTLEMSAAESSSDAPQTATSQAKEPQGTGAATAAARALDPAPSAPAVEESTGISASTDGHGASATIAPVSGTEESSTQAVETHDALPHVSSDTHQEGVRAEISDETTAAEAAESSETMDQLLDQFPTPEPVVTEGEIFDGRVLAVTDAGVIVDVGGKFEGLVPAQEFADSGSAIEFGPGQTIEVERLHEHKDGYVLLSHVRAHRRRVWERIEKSYRQHSDIKGKVSERIKGGLVVDIGVRAFLPASQIELRPVHDLEGWKDREIDVRVLKLNRKRGNVVVSRRAILEEEQKAKREALLATHVGWSGGHRTREERDGLRRVR